MAKLSRHRLARALVRLISEQPGRKAELLRQTAAYLVQTKQAHQAHLLLSDIAEELLRTQKHLSADVHTAFALTGASRDSIVAMLKRETGAQTVELYERVEPALIGGIKVQTSGLEFDASVKRQLMQLAKGL